MLISVEKPGSPEEVLAHFGKKGMKWGVRNESRSSGGSRGSAVKTKAKSAAKSVGRKLDDVSFELGKTSDYNVSLITNKAGDKLIKDLPSIKARHGDYGKMRNRVKKPFSKEAKAYRADVSKAYLKHLETSANELTNVQGTRQYTLTTRGKPNTSKYFWTISTQQVKHAAEGTFTVNPIFDDEGWIIDVKLVEEDMAQTMDRGLDFLTHMGIDV